MNYRRGDVVIIDYPYADASGTKVRPALIAQEDTRNVHLPDAIVVFITKNLSHIGRDATQLLIDVTTADGALSGLAASSAVKCGKLFTVHESLIRKKIGFLPSVLMNQIDACLKRALGLP
jgi:mRNA interferase MazF